MQQEIFSDPNVQKFAAQAAAAGVQQSMQQQYGVGGGAQQHPPPGQQSAYPPPPATAPAQGGAPAGQQPSGQPELKWYSRWALKGGMTVSGVLVILCGIFQCLSLSLTCILDGILIIFCGVFTVSMEVPACFPFMKKLEFIQSFLNSKPLFIKAGIYVALSIIVVILCPSMASIFAMLFLFVCGMTYGVLAIGKKGDLLSQGGGGGQSDTQGLVQGQQYQPSY